MKILIICGGRTYAKYGLIDAAIHAEKSQIRALVIGDAKGADAHAKNSAVLRKILFERLEADWKVYGRSAGTLRNEAMLQKARELVELHPNDTIELWAFRDDLFAPDPNTGGNGTLDMCGRVLSSGFAAKWFSNTLLARPLTYVDHRVVALEPVA